MTYFKKSIMRVMGIICIIVGASIGLLAVILNRDLTAAGMLAASFLVPAFGGKAIQSFSENRNHKDHNEEKF